MPASTEQYSLTSASGMYGGKSDIGNILNKYNVSSWDEFNKLDKDVLDRNIFSMSIVYNNDKKISTSVYMMYPNNYKMLKNIKIHYLIF